MNIATFEKAMLTEFAYRDARATGSLACMKAICYVIRNRVKAGWADTWLAAIESHPKVEGNIMDGWAELDPQDRLLQLLARDVDDIYMGVSEDDTKRVVQDALFYQFIDRPPSPVFVKNILRDPQNHPRIAQVGPIAFFK